MIGKKGAAINWNGLIASRWGTFLPLAFVVANALIWSFLPLWGANLNVHGDSYEAFVWGHEFQLGYYKHPPFWAWLCGLWFSVFPHTDWAFFFLSELNASLGLWGVWALLGRVTRGPGRLAGTALLLLTSFYTFNALRFNANTIQLSLWPWTMYFFLLSFTRKSWASGVAFGFFSACAVLSKYYAGLLLLACLAAALTHKDRAAYFRSGAPWAAVGTACLLVSPHLYWLVQNHFLPFSYVGSQLNPDRADDTGFFLSFFLYLLPSASVLLFLKLTQRTPCPRVDGDALLYDKAFLSVLGLLPLGLTLFLALIGSHVMPHYILPAFSLVPFLLLCSVPLDPGRVARASIGVYALILAVLLCVSPCVPGLVKRPFKPLQEAASAAVQEWGKAVGSPLRIVSGSNPYAEALAFYAPGDVSELSYFTYAYAPWVTPQRIAEQGMLVLCLSSDRACLDQARAFETPQTTRIEKSIVPRWGRYTEAPVDFTFILIPPR